MPADTAVEETPKGPAVDGEAAATEETPAEGATPAPAVNLAQANAEALSEALLAYFIEHQISEERAAQVAAKLIEHDISGPVLISIDSQKLDKDLSDSALGFEYPRRMIQYATAKSGMLSIGVLPMQAHHAPESRFGSPSFKALQGRTHFCPMSCLHSGWRVAIVPGAVTDAGMGLLLRGSLPTSAAVSTVICRRQCMTSVARSRRADTRNGRQRRTMPSEQVIEDYSRTHVVLRRPPCS
eukprot:scaffold2535_cov336-Prasinococcus_capsulatus_cf.AAC.4